METLNFEYEAKGPVTRQAHIGVVGSGDLEVLIEPSGKPTAEVRVRTSVDGYTQVWKDVLDRFFAEYSGFNHFTQTVIRSSERGEIMRWPPRMGTRKPL